MSDPRERLRAALDHLAIDADVNSAHTTVIARARSIRRRRRAFAAITVVTILVAATAEIATTGKTRHRVTVTTPDSLPTRAAAAPRIVASVAGRGLVVLDPTTGAVTATLDNAHGAIGAVSASPDGRDVYYVAGAAGYDPTCGHAQILHHPIGEAAGVADPVARGIFPTVDPTGTRLAYMACDGPSGYTDTLVIRDLLSGAERRIPVNPADRSWWGVAPSWSPDGHHLALRVVEGPTGGSPLRIIDLDHDASLAAARVVGFTDSGDVFGYLGHDGELLGAVDSGAQRSRVVAMTLGATEATPARTLFAINTFPISAVADATGRNVLALSSSQTGDDLYVWSAGAASAERLPARITFADWLPNPSTTTTQPDDGLTVVFSHRSPDGSTVTARVGDVSIAEAHDCDGVAPVRTSTGLDCVVGTVPGIRFDFSGSGAPVYRLTALDADFPVGPGDALRPLSIASVIRVVRADGSSVLADNGTRHVEIVAFHTTGVATVRVTLTGGGVDQMKPVDGWSAFAARSTGGSELFGMTVDGLDATGHVIATSIPYRCC